MAIELTKNLIELPSVTPDDAGCQALIAERLERAGFTTRHMKFDDVDNLWATHGDGDPLFCFLGHTDVVAPGDLNAWQSDPFSAEIRGDFLYGRGAADMKGSVAAMVLALEQFVRANPAHRGTCAMLLTSDEEGVAVNGTVKVIEQLQNENTSIKWCLVGEPSSQSRLGDVVKNGRRGSLGARLVVNGIQGHVAYPALARNPVHDVAPALAELCATEWDQGNEFYPPTSFQVSNIHAGQGTVNVIPGQLEVLFNFRFSTEVTADELIQKTESILHKHKVEFDIEWNLSGLPFLTASGELVDAVKASIREATGIDTQLSTAGGTSDGRFVAPTGAEVVELGPVNETIHKVNECVSVKDLESLPLIYGKVLEHLLT